jgi:hypothetical protein
MPLGRVSIYFDDLGQFARHLYCYSSSNAHVLLVRPNAYVSLITTT